MAKQQPLQQPSTPWGTLEELLLACAVNRHGTDRWDSIAMEVSNRTSTLSSLTSQNCIDKFDDLKRRFGFPTELQNDTASLLVDELRKLRVDELRREVHQRDVSIVSLEMKVKRLEEDREKSLKEKPPDLPKPSPETVAGKSATGEECGDGDERSFNESNSTSQQPQKAEAEAKKERDEDTEVKPEPDSIKDDPDPARLGSDPEAEREWSYNGKLEDEDDKKPKKEMKIESVSRVGVLGPDSNELGESVGESKREEKEKDIKQINNSNNNNNNNNSDVQSSVSLSLKKKKRRRGSGEGSSSGEEEREGGDDEVSPATKTLPAVKSEPWLKLLEIIRSHQLGSIFEKRLRSQESERYKKLIRQHMDLQMIQSRLDKGVYSKCFKKLFKDLLILLNNAIVFFRKNSPENLAANELRAVVLKEMKEKLQKPKPKPVAVKPATEQYSASFSKPNKSTSTMVACSKHSSIKAISEGAGKKDDKKDAEIEEKPKANEKKLEVSIVRIEEKGLKKKTTKERSVSGRRNSRASNKNGEIKHQYGGNELSSHDALEITVDRKESTGRKKLGAASFLKRMKQNSPGQVTENDDDDSSSSEDESKDSKTVDKKRRRREADRITKRVTRSSKGRGLGEDSRNIKRGRPPKKQMDSGGGTGKRGREDDDSEVGVGGAGRAKKRSRR
ncbi:hypothetical protein POPTR_T042048v4 [Populus trichocarpa]|uniref:Uncharacterized protein n=1 Tax=Populus trichocarpa TaxID=3694 RepID=A0ACC0RJB9_POPTR|nr:uncharacterized protein LOC7463613 [Populus trichocarpa]KAI9215541.1 hypothetical protein POPTR_T042048v4 [Populus trichocarpa]